MTSADLAPARPADEREILARDGKRRAARVRSELHVLLAALARKEWDEALRALRAPGDWTAESLQAALAPYFAAHAKIDLAPRARRPDRTTLTEESPRVYRAQQRFGPPPRALGQHEAVAADPDAAAQAEARQEADDADWSIECRVDLSDELVPGAPLLELTRIGV